MSMLRLLSSTSRLLASTARPCLCRVALPPSSSPSSISTSFRSLSTALLSPQTPLQRLLKVPTAASSAAPAIAGQTRGFKMPRSMRKVSSPVARNTGKGKTARKHSARSAKRRRMRRGKIN
ncbi:hypothetical protein JCM10908_004774 [Rhodotorula pacifica]|uniref:uncharacterized protein n=1 Tax=Rhodotorula pacifica TaxID=1495444 RepID=UPI00318068CC